VVQVKDDLVLDIGEVAARTGLTASALRFYERKGLITPVGRNGLRRTYDVRVLDRLALIVLCRSAGFALAEVGEMLQLDTEAERRHRMRRQLTALDEQIDLLRIARERLGHAVECESPTLFDCPHFVAALREVLPAQARSGPG
jgi:DNA-binding transcriptional MerR regulator